MKKPYRKPELTKVPLRPEEAVLTGCKTNGRPGPFNPCNSAGSCSTLTS